ncbi:MAG: DUF2721 domain-containing protein [Acidobacteria bacterium]|nr:DUF2721 domain-containing protein [Acidobacteriota bacterium]
MNLPNLLSDAEFFSLSKGLAVLTSMITPALLLSASGTFILSTSHRLGRCVDRIRRISDQLEYQIDPATHKPVSPERTAMLLRMLDYSGRRARMLARVMITFYLAAGTFVATSVAIGVASLFVDRLAWLPVVLGITGALFMSYGGFRLIIEARLSEESLLEEIAYVDKSAAKHTAAPDL